MNVGVTSVSWEALLHLSGGPIGVLQYTRKVDSTLFLFIFGTNMVALDEHYTSDHYFVRTQRKFNIVFESLSSAFRSKYRGENVPYRQRYITE
jgi:hypothetical protein